MSDFVTETRPCPPPPLLSSNAMTCSAPFCRGTRDTVFTQCRAHLSHMICLIGYDGVGVSQQRVKPPGGPGPCPQPPPHPLGGSSQGALVPSAPAIEDTPSHRVRCSWGGAMVPLPWYAQPRGRREPVRSGNGASKHGFCRLPTALQSVAMVQGPAHPPHGGIRMVGGPDWVSGVASRGACMGVHKGGSGQVLPLQMLLPGVGGAHMERERTARL